MPSVKAAWGTRLGNDHTVTIEALSALSETALTREVEISLGVNGLPNTFVPGRNLIFLTFAAAIGFRRGLKNIVGGMCETDFSGYPDCRDDTIKAMQVVLNLGMGSKFVLYTPLMWLDKVSTWEMASSIGGEPFVELVRTDTHTCYLGNRNTLHNWG